MENRRRPFDRSLSKEPILKKFKLNEDSPAPDRNSNGRAGVIQRPTAANSGGGSRVQRNRDSESIDSVRGPDQHQELVNQYKTALAELTFNSKPIITNLTIIAGENVHAAKAIAAIICANILEVPSEQKLPSLYLLDSIVKNIGRDYIKYFAPRLPEVFCKAYRHVDPSTHGGMRHLFGTWKGVFPLQSLQMIEKELGFTTAVNGSSSGTTTSKPDSQVQRPGNSIHVNPKYLEARQRLQTTRARAAGSDIGTALVNSHEDVESLERPATTSSGRSWADPYAKNHHREEGNEPVLEKISRIEYVDSEYGSSVSGRSGLGRGRLKEKLKGQGFDTPWYESGSDVSNQKNGYDLKHGLESYVAQKPANSDSHLQLKQNFNSRSTNGMSTSWKNSEEEEYMWDEMNRPTDRAVTDTSAKDQWAPDSYDRLDFDSLIRKPQSMHNTGSRIDDEASADSISKEMGRVASGTRLPLSSWSQEMQPPEGRMLLAPGNKISGYSEGYPTGLRNSTNTVMNRSPFQSQLGQAHIGASSYKLSNNVIPGPNVPMTQRQALGAAPSSTYSSSHQHPPSPSSANNNQSQQLNNFPDRYQTSTGPPTDPRRPPGLRNARSFDQSSHDSLPLPSRDVYQANNERLQSQSLRTSSAVMPPLQQRKHVPSNKQKNLLVSDFASSGEGQNLFSPQILGSESLSTLGNSSSEQSNPFTVDSPGQSITSSLLDSVVKSGILGGSSLAGCSTKPDFQEVGSGSSVGGAHPPLPLPSIHGKTLLPGVSKKQLEQPSGSLPSSLADIGSEQKPSTVNSTSNPFSNLLSSLVAKGLISASKSDSSTQKTDKPPDINPGVTSTSSIPVSSVPATIAKSITIKEESSSLEPAAKSAESLPTKIKNLIGYELRPNILRDFHPDVVSDLLSDFPHQCNVCGLRIKLQEQLDRHMEWHSLKVHEQNNSDTPSRRWYANSVEWITGVGPSNLSGESDEALESNVGMVPADESQCACILCGELFEDFYSHERNEWMFKGAVYLSIPSSDEKIGTTNATASLGPIVHAKCINEDSVHDWGLGCDVKVEKDV
ncbi:hypothetical protein ACJIZ3_021832 [Penstemon smallii]|uniref:CID domain-containing protein n=1 Tax=Penstemon smallii TaxID=265156 RepID=A0ABD3SMS4_9LAMI